VLKGVPGEWTIYRIGAALARSEPPP
jgi:hypothetical protein